jgi:hypothetical protein
VSMRSDATRRRWREDLDEVLAALQVGGAAVEASPTGHRCRAATVVIMPPYRDGVRALACPDVVYCGTSRPSSRPSAR